MDDVARENRQYHEIIRNCSGIAGQHQTQGVWRDDRTSEQMLEDSLLKGETGRAIIEPELHSVVDE